MFIDSLITLYLRIILMSKTLSGRIHPGDNVHEFVANEKVGNVFTGSMHIICAVVGIGVLALPYSIAFLGWIAGPLVIFFFWLSTWLSSSMLSSLYLVDGHVYGSYHHLVNGIMGRRQVIMLSCIQVLNLVLIMIAYAITGGLSVTQVCVLKCLLLFLRISKNECMHNVDTWWCVLCRLPTWHVHLRGRQRRKFQTIRAALD